MDYGSSIAAAEFCIGAAENLQEKRDYADRKYCASAAFPGRRVVCAAQEACAGGR
uniref:Uncharacterized protein n=1 Tax=Rhizobium leguminosarum bv. viciae TaxID=387 RepID=A0A0U3JQU4_RHILV|nr:hypothetical protein [Rhizobium leguminosarum bv. viciae]